MPVICREVLAFTAVMALMPKIIRVTFMKAMPKLAPTSEVQDRARSYMILSFLFMLAAFISYVLLVIMIITSPEFYCNFWAKLGVIGQAVIVMGRLVQTICISATNRKNKVRIIGWE